MRLPQVSAPERRCYRCVPVILVKMQLVLRAGFQRHETVRERRIAAFAPAGIIQIRELILDGKAGPGVHFVPPAAGRHRRRVGRAGELAAIGHNPISGLGVSRSDRRQIVRHQRPRSDCIGGIDRRGR
jgi:hypothetical protein